MFCGHHDFIQHSLMNRKYSKPHLFEIEILINAFTSTFDQLNASLLDKSTHLFSENKNLSKNRTDPKLLNGTVFINYSFECV